MATITAEVFQNENLPDGGTDVHAVVAVTCTDAGAAGQTASAAEIVIVDTSGSMSNPGTKIRAVRSAAQVALEEIVDGTEFAVIAGAGHGSVVFPHEDIRLATMTKANREAATRAVKQLDADGGTALGSWLRLATSYFQRSDATQCHAILLTDGRNEGEKPEDLHAAVAAAQGVFQCDARGVGTDWEVAELRYIADALLGTVDLIAQPEDMEADFEAMMRNAMGRGVADAKLRVWAPQGAEVLFVRQVAPEIVDLTGRGTRVSELVQEFPTGAWGDESREFHVAVRVPAKAVGAEQLAARVQLVIGDDTQAQGLVKAMWSDDTGLTTRINPAVAHYTGQAELAENIQDGLAARAAGDEATATAKLGRAVQLAASTGNEDATNRLRKVVDVEDPATGTVRLRKDVSKLDEMALDTRSTKTTRVR
ncbi:MAG: von Willebrand factor type [Actinomycetia bacterium]|nr:von Willebrand factor type [Actinomycetes bacterium]